MYKSYTPDTKRRADFTDFPRVEWKKEAQTRPLSIIGVNYHDSLEEINNFAAEFGLTMPLVQGGSGNDSVSKAYGVMAYPTNYIVDSSGTVIATFVGFDEEGIMNTLHKLGISN